MTKIKSLDDIKIYQSSLIFTRSIYALTRNKTIARDFSLCDQIRRAALSIPANIAEGYGRRTRKDFANFLSISLGSANEVIAYLDFIRLEYNLDIENLKEESNILAKQIYNLRKYLLTHNQ